MATRPKPDISFRDYVSEAWHVIEPGTVFVPNWHIDAVCEHLEAATVGDIRELLINFPPRHMKSLLVSVLWPTWVWTFWPESRWLSASYALALARRDTVKARRIIQSPWYQDRWGGVFRMSGDQNEKSRYENDRTGHRIATSVDSAVTGEGGDIISVDDPHNVREAHSKAARDAVIDWWDNAMTTRLNDQKTGVKVIVMQRLHEKDLSGHVLEKGGWEHLMLPAEFEPARKCFTGIGFEDPRTDEGELLWPEKVGPAELAKMKRDLGSYGAAGQLQQRPAPLEGGLFKHEWFTKTVAAAPDGLRWVRYWDLAVSTKSSADYTASAACAMAGDGTLYIRDMVRGRWEWPDARRVIKETMLAEPRTSHVIEKALHGAAALQELRRDRELTHITLRGVSVDTDKVTRANAWAARAEAGKVVLVRGEWVNAFIDEVTVFPQGAHDDQVDTVSGAVADIGAHPDHTLALPASITGPSTWRRV